MNEDSLIIIVNRVTGVNYSRLVATDMFVSNSLFRVFCWLNKKILRLLKLLHIEHQTNKEFIFRQRTKITESEMSVEITPEQYSLITDGSPRAIRNSAVLNDVALKLTTMED